MMEVNEVITIDVRGTKFCTTKQTLLSDPKSVLAKIFASESPSSPRIKKNGVYFLDSDPTCFRVILNYLRSGYLDLDCCNANALLKEASFYGLSGLEAAIQERTKQQEAGSRHRYQLFLPKTNFFIKWTYFFYKLSQNSEFYKLFSDQVR